MLSRPTEKCNAGNAYTSSGSATISDKDFEYKSQNWNNGFSGGTTELSFDVNILDNRIDTSKEPNQETYLDETTESFSVEAFWNPAENFGSMDTSAKVIIPGIDLTSDAGNDWTYTFPGLARKAIGVNVGDISGLVADPTRSFAVEFLFGSSTVNYYTEATGGTPLTSGVKFSVASVPSVIYAEMTSIGDSSLTANIGEIGGAIYKFDTMAIRANRKPVAQDRSTSAIQLNWTEQIDLTSGATDADGDTISEARIESGPSNGELIFKNNKLVRWVPRKDFTGTDTFTYSVFDGYQWSDPKTVTVTVTPDQNIINPTPAIGVFKLGSTAPPNAETDPGACGDLSKVADPGEGFDTEDETEASREYKILLTAFIAMPLWQQNLILAGGAMFGYGPGAVATEESNALLSHFLWGNGSSKSLDVQKILSDSITARASWNASIGSLIALVGDLEFVGTIHLAETKATLGSTGGSNWEAAIGQFTGWAMADVTGSITDDGNISYSISLHYNIWDPYDWDSSKGGEPAKLAKLHLEGYAKQFLMEGSMQKSISWTKGQAPATPSP